MQYFALEITPRLYLFLLLHVMHISFRKALALNTLQKNLQLHFQSGSAKIGEASYTVLLYVPYGPGLTPLHNHDGHMFNHFCAALQRP